MIIMKKIYGIFLLSLFLIPLYAKEASQQIVRCKDLEIKLVSRHYWNMNSLDFAGVNLCRSRSYFGNVARFECGWVGTGHKENKIGEKELKVEFFADGKKFTPSGKAVSCEKFEMKKSSVLLDLHIAYTFTLTPGKLVERAKVTVLRDTDVKILYLFMHPWLAFFEQALCKNSDGTEEIINFNEKSDTKTFIRKNLHSICYTANKEKIKATTSVKTITPAPEGKEQYLFWNRGIDRKLYFQPIKNQSLKAGTVFEYEMSVDIERM